MSARNEYRDHQRKQIEDQRRITLITIVTDVLVIAAVLVVASLAVGAVGFVLGL